MEPLLEVDDEIWLADSGRRGPSACIAFGVHGNERAPVDAGLSLVESLRSRALRLRAGRLLLVHGSPRARAQDTRFTRDGVDLNRCFGAPTLAAPAALYEQGRAQSIARELERAAVATLVDFHCTIEPGSRFLMHHPSARDAAHRALDRWLKGEVLIADPGLSFGGTSLDEYMSTRGRVGVCYETGWLGDPALSPAAVREEMENVLAGLGLIEREPVAFDSKELLELDGTLRCDGDGFRWRTGIGLNLQHLEAGTVLGAYADGREVGLDRPASLIFPKKRPELLQLGQPLVFLASRKT